jgi:serine/threonine-protein kinase TTK/MPS1
MPVYGAGALRISRHASTRFVRRDSPPSHVTLSQSTTTAPQRLADDSDDDLQPPPQLSALGRSVLESQQDEIPAAGGSSPKPRTRPGSRPRLPRVNTSESNTPARDTTTPAVPSQRVKRVGLQGAPVRRGKRTPQSEEEHGGDDQRQSQEEEHDVHHNPAPQHRQHEHPPEQDQENAPESIARRSESALRNRASVSKPAMVMTDSVMKTEGEKRHIVIRERNDKAIPLAQMSANTPHRPAPPPPPKMSMLEAATKAAGASTTRKKVRRQAHFVMNGKTYTQLERCGKGGSGDVYRVQAENGKPFALKRVRLDGVDPVAIAGYKAEIDLLRKLSDTDRVVRLYDYTVDEEKQVLLVVSLRLSSVLSIG